MARNRTETIVADAEAKSRAWMEAIPAGSGRRRANAERIVAVCRDLVSAKPAVEPLSPPVTERGKTLYGWFPAEQTLLNHYRGLLRIWRDAFGLIVVAAAPVPVRKGGSPTIDESDLRGVDAGTRARVRQIEVLLREAKLENDRLKRIIRETIPAPGHSGGASSSGLPPPSARVLREWLASLDSGAAGFEVAPGGVRVTNRTRPGTVAVPADVLDVLRSLSSGPPASADPAGRAVGGRTPEEDRTPDETEVPRRNGPAGGAPIEPGQRTAGGRRCA